LRGLGGRTDLPPKVLLERLALDRAVPVLVSVSARRGVAVVVLLHVREHFGVERLAKLCEVGTACVGVSILRVEELQNLRVLALVVAKPEQVVDHLNRRIHGCSTAILAQIFKVLTKVDGVWRAASDRGRGEG